MGWNRQAGAVGRERILIGDDIIGFVVGSDDDSVEHVEGRITAPGSSRTRAIVEHVAGAPEPRPEIAAHGKSVDRPIDIELAWHSSPLEHSGDSGETS